MERNKEIRTAIKSAGLRHWQLADALKISEGTLVRRLRHELPDKEKATILNAVDAIALKN